MRLRPSGGTNPFGGSTEQRRCHSPAAFGNGGEEQAGNSQSVGLPFLPPLLFHPPSVPQPRTPRAPAARAVNIKTGFVSASKGSKEPAAQPCRGPQPSPAAAAASPKAAGGWHGGEGFPCRPAHCRGGGSAFGGGTGSASLFSLLLPPQVLWVSAKRGCIAPTPQPSIGSRSVASGLELNRVTEVTPKGKRKKKESSAPCLLAELGRHGQAPCPRSAPQNGLR